MTEEEAKAAYIKVRGSISSYRDYVGFSTKNIEPKELLAICDRKTKLAKKYVAHLMWVDLEKGIVSSPLVAASDPMSIVDILLSTSTESGTPFILAPRKNDSEKMKKVKITWEENKLKKVYAHFRKYCS